ALTGFRFGQVEQEAPIAPVFGFGGGDHAGIFRGHGGQSQRAQQQRQRIVRTHEATSCTCGSSNASYAPSVGVNGASALAGVDDGVARRAATASDSGVAPSRSIAPRISAIASSPCSQASSSSVT